MCNVCLSVFANKTQKENHRKAVHPRNLGVEIEDDDLKMDEVPKFDIVEDGADKIIGERNGLFMMKYDEYTQWLSLTEDNPYVKDWREEQREDNIDDSLPLISKTQLREWLGNINTANEVMVEEDLYR